MFLSEPTLNKAAIKFNLSFTVSFLILKDVVSLFFWSVLKYKTDIKLVI